MKSPRCIWFVVSLCILSFPSLIHAQEPEVSFVTSDGVGTVYVPPTHVLFWLHFSLPEGKLQQGLVAEKSIEGQLREFFSNREVHPVSTEIYSPHIDSLAEGRSTVAVALKFSMAGLVGGETGAAKFGALCDLLNVLGEKLLCRVSEPDLVITEGSAVIQEAVQEATRQAFIAASGAAVALGVDIRAVERVKVRSVEWNNPPNVAVTYPTIERVACTARVTVTYTL